MNRRSHRCFCAAGLVLLAVVAAGCDNGPELAPVTGVVYMDGKPLSNATIEFQPDAGSPSFAMTKENGSFELKFSRDRMGAMPGQHTVSIRTKGTVTDPDGTERRVRELLPVKYHDESELVREVVSGDNAFEFRLESDPQLARRAARGR